MKAGRSVLVIISAGKGFESSFPDFTVLVFREVSVYSTRVVVAEKSLFLTFVTFWILLTLSGVFCL